MTEKTPVLTFHQNFGQDRFVYVRHSDKGLGYRLSRITEMGDQELDVYIKLLARDVHQFHRNSCKGVTIDAKQRYRGCSMHKNERLLMNWMNATTMMRSLKSERSRRRGERARKREGKRG